MRDELLELSRTIDLPTLGERLRSARLRAGLTQTQVAGETVSVGYVSRIESGQRRPDPQLLETLAGRLGITVDELLVGISPDRLNALRVELDHAELALATGSAGQALETVDRILADPAIEDLPDLERDASYLRASALEATGDLQAAIILLEDLAESGPGDLAWIDGLTALCRCYRDSGELGRAIEVGNQGARRIDELGLDGVDEAIKLSLTLAAAYYEQGDVGYAARLCQRAVDRAEAMASPVAKAMAYWNSSVIESLRGNAAAAMPMTRRALAVIEASENARNTARLRSQLGLQQLQLDPPEPEAAMVSLVQASEELAVAQAGPVDLAMNRLALARAHLLLGDTATALDEASRSVEATRGSAPIVAAEALALVGEIAAHEGALETARSHFQEAVLLLSGIGADRSAAQLWFELAGLLEGVGETEAALDAYRRAAAATGLTPAKTRQLRSAPQR